MSLSINSLGLILQLRMQQNIVNLCHHLHSVIRIFPSAFCHPHFSIRILSSAIRRHPVRTLQRSVSARVGKSFAT